MGNPFGQMAGLLGGALSQQQQLQAGQFQQGYIPRNTTIEDYTITASDTNSATLDAGMNFQVAKPKTNMEWLDHRIDEIRVKL